MREYTIRKDHADGNQVALDISFEQSDYNRKPYTVKCTKKKLPPNGRFYQDVLDGLSQFPGEPVALIYIGRDQPYEYAKHAIELGLQPPMVISSYLNPFAFHWPVKGMKVRVIEKEPLSITTRDKLVLALTDDGATEVQYCPLSFNRNKPPIRKPSWEAVLYE
jgi:hypothetical protein